MPQPIRIVLKLDDTRPQNGAWPERWQRVDDFCAGRGIVYTIGVIANSLEGDNPAYIASLKAIAESGRAELWHHGYDHKQWEQDGSKLREFQGSGYEHQIEHLRKAQALAKEKLGVTFTTFGAPYNATDADTVRALEEMTEIKVWLYGPSNADTSKFVAGRSVNIEHPVHKPNLEAFKAGYAQNQTKPYLVIQGHPLSWDDNAFAEFVGIIDFLQGEGARFVLSRDLPQG